MDKKPRRTQRRRHDFLATYPLERGLRRGMNGYDVWALRELLTRKNLFDATAANNANEDPKQFTDRLHGAVVAYQQHIRRYCRDSLVEGRGFVARQPPRNGIFAGATWATMPERDRRLYWQEALRLLHSVTSKMTTTEQPATVPCGGPETTPRDTGKETADGS